MADNNNTEISNNPLGIDATSLGSLKAKDLVNNKALANTLLTYTRNCESKITELETENETLKTYANDYELSILKQRIAVLLTLLGTVLIGFGINYLTGNTTNNDKTIPGWILLSFGLILSVISGVLLLKRK